MPEHDSDPESLRLGGEAAAAFGLSGEVEDIGPMLEALGCYRRREAFIREVVPEYGPGWLSKIVIANALSNDGYNISSLVVQSPEGEQKTVRLPLRVYQGIVASTNMKQRTRKEIEYYHADRLNYAVIGTPNRLEYDQGFFVKNGDGAADVKPIAHLYKSQVYQLAEYWSARRNPQAPADNRYVFAPADPGGILLLPSLRPYGSLPLRIKPRCACGRSGRRGKAHQRAASSGMGRYRRQAQGYAISASPAAAG